MRHLYGVALAVIMAAAVFFAASWGYIRVTTTRITVTAGMPGGGGSLLHYHTILQGGGALLGVGLLLGLLMVIPWVSPLATGLPGLALLAWTGLYLMDVKDAFRFIPLKKYTYGSGFEELLMTGLLAVIGLAMVIPLFIPSRWVTRSRFVPLTPQVPDGGDLTETMAGYPGQANTAAEGGLLSDWAQTRPQPQVNPGPPTSQAPWGPADYS
jgi:hypothetical protein